MGQFKPSRRLMIFTGIAAAGGLAIGWALMPYSTLPRARELAGRDGETLLRNWVRIGADNSVTVFVPHVDFGQGSQTAVAMMLAEELDADWARVRVEEAPADAAFANGGIVRMFALGDADIPAWLAPAVGLGARRLSQVAGLQITGGSSAVRGTGAHLIAPAGAAARWMLCKAASEAWDVPQEEIATNASTLSHAASNRTATFGEMAEDAARYEPPSNLPLKDPSAYRIVGTSPARLDLPAKVDGTALYPHDLRLPGMLYAAVVQTPVIGGSLRSVDTAPATAMRGVSNVIQREDAVIVIADNTWRARNAAAALTPQWDDGENGAVASSAVLAEMERALTAGEDLKNDHKAGDAEAALSGAVRKVEAVYRLPYLVHAQMAPPATVAQFKDDHLTVWCSVQNPLGARREAAKRADLPEDKVTLNNMVMGGGFGRGGFNDYILFAVDAAMATPGTPVQASLTREEDMTHGFYRQASVAKLEGGLDAEGRIVALRNSYTERRDAPDVSALQYSIANHHIRYLNGLNPMRWGFWRSVDNTLHGFTVESFMDELAHAAGQDPLAFRRAYASARGQAVLDRVAELSHWSTPAPEGRARGVALRESFGTMVAQVAEVSVGDDGALRVHAMYSAVDAGRAVHPGNLAAQIQGAVNFGLSAALYGEITVENGRVVQQNFPDYDIVRMGEAPRQVVSVVDIGSPLGGGGEPGTPAVAAAVCNAIFAATGARIRELPLKHFDLRTGARRQTV
jgi:isoquinoline 1-oxidoreductase beta subunit